MHAVERGKQRIFPEFNEFDLKMIEILIMCGLCKEIEIIPKQVNRKLYHLRYGRRLVEAIVDDRGLVVTFLPVGKRVSHKRHYKERYDYDYSAKMKRLNKKY